MTQTPCCVCGEPARYLDDEENEPWCEKCAEKHGVLKRPHEELPWHQRTKS